MDRRILMLAVIAPLAAGCMPDNPHTAFDWDVNTHPTPRPNRVATAAPAGGKVYTYDEGGARPTPRPAPDYVTRNVAPYAPSNGAVTSKPLAPVATAAAGAPAFAWPVSGRVISDFGSPANGARNDGINIATAAGTPIHASASGTVTYAGDELKNYGNLVLVKHSGGYTTAYAHADRIVVTRGDFVAKGQVIAYAGQTGDVDSPQLHFEIRSATTPVNPRALLSSTTASN